MTHDPTYPRLLGDVGGTNTRLAWQSGPGALPADVARFRSADHASLRDVVELYLQRHAQRPRWGAIGIATPVWGDQVHMTNHDWSFSIVKLQHELALDRLLVINDFTAQALALPTLSAADLEPVGGGQAVDGALKALVGPGTGLGVSALLPATMGRGPIPLPGEGGHVTLAAADEQEDAVLAILRSRFEGHASAERAASGPGLVHLHDALCELAGMPAPQAPPLTPEQVAARALAQEDPHCVGAVELFFSFLGTISGNLALTLNARGGVYIAGGVVPHLGDRIHRSRFRDRFESKGRFSEALRAIPTWVIRAKVSPALAGAARALEEL